MLQGALDEETLKKYILGGHVSGSGCYAGIALQDGKLGLACRKWLHKCFLRGYASGRDCCARV